MRKHFPNCLHFIYLVMDKWNFSKRLKENLEIEQMGSKYFLQPQYNSLWTFKILLTGSSKQRDKNHKYTFRNRSSSLQQTTATKKAG